MSKVIVQRPAADLDIDSIFSYLMEKSPRAAIKFLDNVEHAYSVLATHPKSGSTRHAKYLSELPYPLRFHVVKGSPRVLIYYMDRPEAIEIIRIWDAARGLEALMDTTAD